VVINKSEQALILALIPMGFENVRKHTLATSYFPLFLLNMSHKMN